MSMCFTYVHDTRTYECKFNSFCFWQPFYETEAWWLEIRMNVKNCTSFVCLFSRHSQNWCQVADEYQNRWNFVSVLNGHDEETTKRTTTNIQHMTYPSWDCMKFFVSDSTCAVNQSQTHQRCTLALAIVACDTQQINFVAKCCYSSAWWQDFPILNTNVCRNLSDIFYSIVHWYIHYIYIYRALPIPPNFGTLSFFVPVALALTSKYSVLTHKVRLFICYRRACM